MEGHGGDYNWDLSELESSGKKGGKASGSDRW